MREHNEQRWIDIRRIIQSEIEKEWIVRGLFYFILFIKTSIDLLNILNDFIGTNLTYRSHIDIHGIRPNQCLMHLYQLSNKTKSPTVIYILSYFVIGLLQNLAECRTPTCELRTSVMSQ